MVLVWIRIRRLGIIRQLIVQQWNTFNIMSECRYYTIDVLRPLFHIDFHLPSLSVIIGKILITEDALHLDISWRKCRIYINLVAQYWQGQIANASMTQIWQRAFATVRLIRPLKTKQFSQIDIYDKHSTKEISASSSVAWFSFTLAIEIICFWRMA